MEHAQGTQLGEVWQDMEIDEKQAVIDEVVAVEKKLCSIFFSCLYFAADAFPGCTVAKVTGATTSELNNHVESNFVIDPVAEQAFNEDGPHPDEIDCGPWFNPQEYLIAIARRERSKLMSTASRTDEADGASRKEKLSVLAKFEAISSHLLPREDDLNRPTLWHWDIRPPNLFVENGRLSSIIDWQDVWVGPLSLQARRPRLVDHDGEMVLRLPDNYEEITDADEKARITDRVEMSIILWCYENEAKKENPELHRLFNLPQIEKRKQTVAFASELSHGDIIPLRGCLIDLSQRWDELETGPKCPIQFSPSELRSHDEDTISWNEIADFWSSLDGFVSRDGWTSLENYQDALRFFQELRDQGLNQLSVSDLVDFQQQSRWVTKEVDE